MFRDCKSRLWDPEITGFCSCGPYAILSTSFNIFYHTLCQSRRYLGHLFTEGRKVQAGDADHVYTTDHCECPVLQLPLQSPHIQQLSQLGLLENTQQTDQNKKRTESTAHSKQTNQSLTHCKTICIQQSITSHSAFTVPLLKHNCMRTEQNLNLNNNTIALCRAA